MSGMAACVKYPYVPYIEFELSTRMLKLPQRHALSQGSEPPGGVGLGENTLLAFLSLLCLLFILETDSCFRQHPHRRTKRTDLDCA